MLRYNSLTAVFETINNNSETINDNASVPYIYCLSLILVTVRNQIFKFFIFRPVLVIT